MRKDAKEAGRKRHRPKTKLGLPDLDQAKAAVLGSLRSPESQRGYRYSIGEFITWYCSEPRLSFSKTVVTRYRIHLEDRQLAPGTINVRLAAVRHLAYEAADSGLLSPELAAGIQRVKGAKKKPTPICDATLRRSWLDLSRSATGPVIRSWGPKSGVASGPRQDEHGSPTDFLIEFAAASLEG
jgi:hypothetical protein